LVLTPDVIRGKPNERRGSFPTSPMPHFLRVRLLGFSWTSSGSAQPTSWQLL